MWWTTVKLMHFKYNGKILFIAKIIILVLLLNNT